MNSKIFKAIIDSHVQETVAAESMSNTIVESVVFNTSVKKRVDEEYYTTIINTTKKLMKSKTVVLKVGKSSDVFTFYEDGKIFKNFYKLMMRLADLDCYYEDTDCYEEDGNNNFGFCWKYTNNSHSTHCGLYAATSADEELKFDCEGEECEW